MTKPVATIHYWAGTFEAITIREGRRYRLGQGADKTALAASLRPQYRVILSQTNPLFMR